MLSESLILTSYQYHTSNNHDIHIDDKCTYYTILSLQKQHMICVALINHISL